MTRHLGLTLASFALAVACLAAGDEPPAAKGGKDKEPAKKQAVEGAAPKDGKDGKDAKDAKPAEPPESREKIIERLKEEFETAGTSLEKKDPGEKTRDTQKKIIDDLDKLIKNQNEQDSRSSSSSSSSNASNSSDSSQSSSSSKGGAGQKSQANQQPQGSKGSQGGKPNPEGLTKKQPQGAGSTKDGSQAKNNPKDGGSGKKDQARLKDGQQKKGGPQQGTEKNGDTSAKKNPIPDENRPGAWGHLSPKMRKEMEAFSRDHIVPRYQSMSMQYFKRTAQHGRGKEGE